MASFTTPDVIITGLGSVESLTEIAGKWGHRAMTVVGGGSAVAGGLLDKIHGLLLSSDIEVQSFQGVSPEPPSQQVDQLRDRLRTHKIDLVIAVGGGSVIDVSKAAAILHYSDKPTDEHLASQDVPNRSLPVIAVPTTAGTGSEVTGTSVLTDRKRKIKRSIRSPVMMPKAAIIDGQLTRSCPPGLTAIAGMDAFTQAIESFCSRWATNVTDAVAEKAISLLGKHLEQAYKDGSDLEARQATTEASALAGMALANARLGVAHGLAHPIGGKYPIPHGLVCAVLLPVVLEFNWPTLSRDPNNKYTRLTELLGGDPVEYVCNLLEKLNLPQDLKNYHIDKKLVDELAEEALISGSTKANPRDATAEDLAAILRRVI